MSRTPNKISFDPQDDTHGGHNLREFILDNSETLADFSPEQPFFFDGLIFGLCLQGTGTIKINFKDYDIEPDSIITILPKNIFKSIRKSDDLMLKMMFLSPDFFSDLPLPKDYDILLKIASQPVLRVPHETMESMLELHGMISRRYGDNARPLRAKIIKGLVYALIMEIGSAYWQQSSIIPAKASSRKEELTEKFFRLLSDNFRTERSVGFYAGKLCLTPKYLSSTVKSVTGHSLQEWINTVVIIDAKKQLKTTDLTVLQISEALNFPNPSFFGRFFKQHTGTTPFRYRNSR